jgi:hypothetical protein
MKTFKVTQKFGTGTSLQGYVNTSYKRLVELFGEPDPANTDDYKVSTEWDVEDESGNVYTIYDYKETKMYSSDGYTIKQFRKLPSYDWHIGGVSNYGIEDLRNFILNSK